MTAVYTYTDLAPWTSASPADVHLSAEWYYNSALGDLRFVLPSGSAFASIQRGISGPSVFPFGALTQLAAREYVLMRPIHLRHRVDGDIYYVSDDILNCWGEGLSFDEARDDYEANLLEMYEDIVHATGPLSRLAEEQLARIRRFIAPA